MLIASAVPGDKLHDRAFAELPSAPSVAWVGAASGDRLPWFERSAEVMRAKYGAHVRQARSLPGPGFDLDDTRAILDEADLIYLGGGDVSLLAERLRAHGLDENIRARRRSGGFVLGVSAGAIGLTPFWVRFPDDEYELPAPARFACIGAVSIACDCHDEDSDWEELRELFAAWQREAPGTTVDGYGIPMGGALFLDGDDRVTHLGPAPKRLRLDQGRIVE